MSMLAFLTVLALASGGSAQCEPLEGTPDLEKILATGREVRAAFKAGDIERIALFHHDNVIKSLGPDRYFEGKEALKADLANTMANVGLEFGEGGESVRESMTLCGDTAIMMSRFSIAWTPKDGGEGGVARGRTMLVLVRSDKAPHGWVTLQELIQPIP